MSKFNEWLKRGVQDEESSSIEDRLYNNSLSDKNKTESMMSSKPYQNVVVYEPRTNSDIQNLIDFLKRREPAIINLNQVDAQSAQRMLDFVSGAVYALSGSVHNIAAKIYLLTPDGISITVPDKQQ